MSAMCLRLPAMVCGLLALVIATGTTARAAEPSSEPILCLETGFHTAPINRVDATQDGTILTVSEDKTARLWRVEGATFIQEQVLRVPIGPGHEGKLFAGAISPDGRWVAVGGCTGYDWYQKCFISLFDRRFGALARRLGPLPGTITHLRFRPDGQVLVACLGGNGIRVFIPSGGVLAWEDHAYGDSSYGACWLPNGGLATTSRDGQIRSYDAQGRRRFAVRSPLGREPYTIANDEQGILAVGFYDTTAVARLRAADGVALEALDTQRVTEGNLGCVAWAAGQWWAGGNYRYQATNGTWLNPVLHWPTAASSGACQAGAGSTDTINDLVSQPGTTRLAVGTADPQVMLLDAQGQVGARRAGVIAAPRDQEKVLACSADARRLRFGLQPGGRTPLVWDTEAGTLTDSPQAPAGCAAATTQAPGFTIQGWRHTTAPTCNGKAIALQPYETTRSLAIAPSGQMALLGTAWWLRALDRQGTGLWKQPVPGDAWGVVASGDGRSAVAACGDGTLRWHRLRDGAPYLSLFVHAGDRRWVAWTPSGYYWASPGAEELIGWHVNRGMDQAADFFPASRFRARFNRPEVIQAIFDTLDETAALAQVGAKAAPALATILPPVVTITDPAGGSPVTASPVTVQYRLRSPSGKPVTRLQVLVDGVEVDVGAERGMKRVISDTTQGDTLAVRVPIPSTNCRVALIASTSDGSSEPASVRLTWAGTAPAPARADLPACYVLAIGVSTYQQKDLALRFPVKDVTDIATAFQAQAGRLYRTVTPQLLTDPTKVQVLDGFDWLAKQCTNRDLAVIVIAGHGEVDSKGSYYLLPADADPERLRATAVPHSDLVRSIQDLPCKKLAFLDTCHAGAAQGGARRRGAADASELINILSDPETGCIMFCAATGRQPSQERDDWGNGAFSKAVVEALTGKAAGVTDPVLTAILTADKITHARLNAYVAERVKQLTGGGQTPTYAAPSTVPDFPVALRK